MNDLLVRPHTLSRRNFLKYAVGGALACSALGCATRATPELRARAVALLDSALSVDIHSHAGGVGSRRDTLTDVGGAMRDGKLSAICMSLVSDSPVLAHGNGKIYAQRPAMSGELRAHVLRRMAFADRLIEKYGMTRVLTLDDLRASKARGVPGAILAVEGSDYLDNKLENLPVAYDWGIRHWQLVHYVAGNGLGDIQTEDPMYDGATPFGLDVVRGCGRLGMVVDVAHATLRTVRQVAEVATTPLVLSHTSFNPAHGKYSRTIGAEHAKVIAATGGVIGLWANGHYFSGFAAYAEGLAKLAEVAGVDHVGIGTDMNGMPTPMQFSYPEFPDMVAHLFKHFNDAEVKGIVGGNYLRVFDKATKKTA